MSAKLHRFSSSIRYDYSATSVTTAAWTTLATAIGNIKAIQVFDSSGQTMRLGYGDTTSPTDYMLVPPGGWDFPVECNLSSGTNLSVKAVSANATSGEITINLWE